MKPSITALVAAACFAIAVVPTAVYSASTKSRDATSAAQCGVPAIKPDTNANIVGGEEAIPYSWPWQVALFTPKLIGNGSYQFCAGTVISNEWILSAGHCFYNDDKKPSKFTVKLGVFSKDDDDETGEVEVSLSEIHVHPQYNDTTTTYDVSLLKLTKPIDYTDHISPVCLPAVQDEALPPAGTGVYVTGWGDQKSGGPDSPDLKQATVPLVDIQTCRSVYPRSYINDTVDFCAGLKQGGEGVCQGDSGGPLVYQDAATGAWKQLGIISWGRGCAPRWSYQVYSRVSAYIDFINQYVTDL